MNRSAYMQGGVGGFTITTAKGEDGSYTAYVPGHPDVKATGPTEVVAIQRLRKDLDERIARGDRL